MKNLVSIVLLFGILLSGNNMLAQTKQTYKVNGTTYISGETYKTTGQSKVERSSAEKTKFLKSRGYDKVPNGYQVDHKVPLSEGGADNSYNMQVISTDQHKAKTANEKASNSVSTTYKTPKYNSTSTYKSSSNYSTPSYSNSPSKSINTGSKGGQYYINSNGNKTYTKRK